MTPLQSDGFTDWITVLQACERLDIKDSSVVRRAIRNGKLFGKKPGQGRDWYVRYNDVLAWKRLNHGKRGRPKSK